MAPIGVGSKLAGLYFLLIQDIQLTGNTDIVRALPLVSSQSIHLFFDISQ